MRRLIIIAATIAALSFTGVASAGGYFNTARQTFYSDFIHVRATYDVYDGNGYCVEDEYGFYEDLTCGNYDDGTADVDLRIMRMGPHPSIVHSERLSGYSGRVSTDLYYWEFARWSCPHATVSYRMYLRLRDPITDRIADVRVKRFRVWCL